MIMELDNFTKSCDTPQESLPPSGNAKSIRDRAKLTKIENYFVC
jgi:hypothetical protein